LAVVLLASIAVTLPAQAANFGVHAGLADDAWADPYFRAGALLADVDHWLPPGEPQTDSLAFSLGLVQRAWPGSRNTWRFATGWYEHLDQDARYGESYARIVAIYPAYTDTDVRLAFDYWTLRKHPFPTDFDWVLGNGEVLQLIAGGLVATDAAGVRAAVDGLLHSSDLGNPGLALQITAANTYGFVYPDRVADMEAEYDRFYGLVTASFVPVLPRIDLALRLMGSIVRRNAKVPEAVLPHLRTAIALEAVRPPNWMALTAAALADFVDALPDAGLPMRARMILEGRADGLAAILT
jgi:hypothetical protein